MAGSEFISSYKIWEKFSSAGKVTKLELSETNFVVMQPKVFYPKNLSYLQTLCKETDVYYNFW